ncbi:MAG: hypothetical protein H0S85_01575 [Desulfovibrionaceae bacterium]|jgi:hypothetical protein|nr:hypothetical protein [Desulfovibrionaceae bacterium]
MQIDVHSTTRQQLASAQPPTATGATGTTGAGAASFGSARSSDRVSLSAESLARSAASGGNKGGTSAAGVRLDFGADEERDVHMDATWGSATLADGSVLTVGQGRVGVGDDSYAGVLVQQENADGTMSVTVLPDAGAYRLTRDETGGWVAMADLQGGDGDDLFVGRDLGSLSLQGGDGDNLVFTTTASGFTYAGGAGSDAIHGAKFTDSAFDLGGGNDAIMAELLHSTVDLGAGDDKVEGVVVSSNLIGGDGRDTIHASVTDSVLDMGAGDDLVKGYALERNEISMGAGDDRLKFYALIDSTVDMDGDGDETGGDAGGKDAVEGYEIIGSHVDTGRGDDVVQVYETEQGTSLHMGEGNDRIEAHSLIDSQVDMGRGNDVVDTYDITGSTVRTDSGQGTGGAADAGGGAGSGVADEGGDDRVHAYTIERSTVTMGRGDDELGAHYLLESVVNMDEAQESPEETEAVQPESGDGMRRQDMWLYGPWSRNRARGHGDAGNAAGNDEVRGAGDATGTSAENGAAGATSADGAGSVSGAGGNDTVNIYSAVGSVVSLGAGDDAMYLYMARELTVGAGEGEDRLGVADAASTIRSDGTLERARQEAYRGVPGEYLHSGRYDFHGRSRPWADERDGAYDTWA